ncbi:MAG: parallel beta-helix domain-containing protein [Ardenticatenaceae bacterium]|nr:parallel beta-helix domain-containing protein [Ardenticatenaceae bacterium]
MKKILRVLSRIILALILIVVGVFITFAVMPAEADPVVPLNKHGAGASSVVPSYTGLQRSFPETNEPADNPTTAAKAELGRLLFFDPILSENDDISCASCHHPDLGFSDGLVKGVGPQGVELTRNTPTLWNVAYVQNLFWDGRLNSLETQAEFPLTHPDEMGVSDTAALEAELRANSQYADLFDQAFTGGEEAISLANVENALAAFQRTLISQNSPFDRYAAGEFEALTAQQRRGLALFRSGATRCFECHSAPTFASDTFRVIGVQSIDPGRAAIASDGVEGAFRVPTLRNIALTSPYMHDGSFETLEDVIEFYADGGGLAHGQSDVDPFVNGFELTNQEMADMVSFLHALTDETSLPAIPLEVPSGLPVVARLENSARDVSAAHNAGGEAKGIENREPQTLMVQAGESIQAAVDRAQPGDTILISYGVYHERVVIDISDITLEGIPNDDGAYPIIDGRDILPEGVLSSGNNFKVGQLHVRNFTDNGILVEGVTGVHFYDIIAEKTGAYGIYPVQSSDVLIERMEVWLAEDAGIYAGQCEDVIVRDSVVYDNVIGIELENTLGGEVYNNHAYNNTTGILLVLLPQLTSKISAQAKVYDNLVEDNNTDNFGRAGTTVSILPPGIGILVLASDQNEVFNNTVTGNKSSGVALFSLTGTGAFDASELDVGPLPEGNLIYDNVYDNNGFDPDQFIRDLGIPAGDILWDGSGGGNRFNEAAGTTSFPPVLPSDSWPEFARHAYGNMLSWVIGLIR